MQVNFVDFFLGFFFENNGLNSFGFLEKMMVEVSFKHQIVSIKFL